MGRAQCRRVREGLCSNAKTRSLPDEVTVVSFSRQSSRYASRHSSSKDQAVSTSGRGEPSV